MSSTTTSRNNIGSRICNFVGSGGVCKRATCTFAHSFEDWQPLRCKFGEWCKSYECGYFHPDFETLHGFADRTGKVGLPETNEHVRAPRASAIETSDPVNLSPPPLVRHKTSYGNIATQEVSTSATDMSDVYHHDTSKTLPPPHVHLPKVIFHLVQMLGEMGNDHVLTFDQDFLHEMRKLE